MMLRSLKVHNFTVFAKARLDLAGNLNVIVGENSSGKSHLLKLMYAALAASAEEGQQPGASGPTKVVLQRSLADKLVGVLRPESLGRLVRRKRGRERCEVDLGFEDRKLDLRMNFATNSRTEVSVDRLPARWIEKPPVFLPTRELLSLYPGFVSLYDTHHVEFEETWRDTCLLLGRPAQRGPRPETVRELLEPLERAMGGTIVLDNNGQFYLDVPNQGRFEMHLVAEGLRKLAMVARLIATGALVDKGCLFWDEPEANLNPRLVKDVAAVLLALCGTGLQVFVATHSLFLMREFDVLLRQPDYQAMDARFFGLHPEEGGVDVAQGPSVDDIGPIASLDEELEQSDRYMAAEYTDAVDR